MKGMYFLPTPSFIFDVKDFVRSFNCFAKALKGKFTRIEIGYSVKTNSFPFLLCEALKNGCFAEVVSEDEWRLAGYCGYSKDRIIYNGSLKSKQTFLATIFGGVL